MFSIVEIQYLGHSAFRIKGKSCVLVTDPYGAQAGKFPAGVTANIVTVSHDHFDHNEVKSVAGSPFVVNGPGEYEVGSWEFPPGMTIRKGHSGGKILRM